MDYAIGDVTEAKTIVADVIQPGRLYCEVGFYEVATTDIEAGQLPIEIVSYGPRGGRYVVFSCMPDKVPLYAGALYKAFNEATRLVNDWVQRREVQ